MTHTNETENRANNLAELYSWLVCLKAKNKSNGKNKNVKYIFIL